MSLLCTNRLSISHDWPPPIEEIEEISLAPHLLASSPTRTSQTTFPLEAVLVEVDDSPEEPRRVTELDEIGLVLPPPLVPTRVSAALVSDYRSLAGSNALTAEQIHLE